MNKKEIITGGSRILKQLKYSKSGGFSLVKLTRNPIIREMMLLGKGSIASTIIVFRLLRILPWKLEENAALWLTNRCCWRFQFNIEKTNLTGKTFY